LVELSIVVPTFNERENVPELVRLLDLALAGLVWEVVFVDDHSPDGTADVARDLARRDARVRCLHRYGRRGLASACVEGILSTSAPYIAVMDADLQHDETRLPAMLAMLKADDLDLVVGSRYAAAGGHGLLGGTRLAGSRAATRLANFLLKTALSDPMSGFFLLKRETLHMVLPNLSAIGFKILLDIVASAKRPLRVAEMPIQFRARQAGESKLDSMVVWEFLMLLADKLFGRWIPPRFLVFSAIGSLGVLIHMATMTLLFKGFDAVFAGAQATATLVAMTANFLLNNQLTYRDRRLRGWRLVSGWLSFAVICGVGAAANVGISSYIYQNQGVGWLPAAFAGVMISAVWNYGVSSLYTWNVRPRSA